MIRRGVAFNKCCWCFRFYSCLTNNLTFKYKEVYAAAAEVIGLLLKQAADVQKVTLIFHTLNSEWSGEQGWRGFDFPTVRH